LKARRGIEMEEQMNKIIKRILLILLPVVLISAVIAYTSYNPMLSMTPAETGWIPGTNIYTIKNNRNNVYFVKAGENYIMIDAGSDAASLMSSLKEIDVDANKVKLIYLTHSDYDHVAALSLFPNANVYMGKREIDLLNGNVKRDVTGGNHLPDGVDIQSIILVGNEKWTLEGADKVNIECIQFMGHTIGSMAYLVDDKYLFTGDAFKVSKGNRLDIHPYTMDKKLAKQMIGELMDTINNSYIVLTGHYGYYIDQTFH
jgi:glyoxylase-like metal-dependent hydrolase (beta-lactamase superfamily II)